MLHPFDLVATHYLQSLVVLLSLHSEGIMPRRKRPAKNDVDSYADVLVPSDPDSSSSDSGQTLGEIAREVVRECNSVKSRRGGSESLLHRLWEGGLFAVRLKQMFSMGATPGTVMAMIGGNTKQFYAWMRKGAAGQDEVYREFYLTVCEGIGEASRS